MKSSSNPDPPWPPFPGQPFNPHRRFRVVCVPEQLLAASLVSPGAKLAYAQLARHAGSAGRCFPRQAVLSEALGVSERQVRRYIRQLEKAALLRTVRRGLNAPNAYEFLWHQIFEKAENAAAGVPNALIHQDRTSMSDQDRTHTAVHDRTFAASPFKEEESHLRESVKRGAVPLPRSIEGERPRYAAAAAAALTPSRHHHVHRRAVESWPELDVSVIRTHLAGIPCQDGSSVEATDELVGRLLNASKLYMRTSFELGALLYRIAGRIRNRPSWWPESEGSAAAWLLSAIDREYGPDFIAARKPPGSGDRCCRAVRGGPRHGSRWRRCWAGSGHRRPHSAARGEEGAALSRTSREVQQLVIPDVPGRRPLAELVQSTLSRVPSRFCRLVYLARCCGSRGVYEHYGLELDHKAGDVHAALRQAHIEEWNHWLGALSLEQQFTDVLEYLDGLNPRQAIQWWEPAGDPWDIVVPQAAPRAERELFRANFRALLVLLKARFR